MSYCRTTKANGMPSTDVLKHLDYEVSILTYYKSITYIAELVQIDRKRSYAMYTLCTRKSIHAIQLAT